MDWKAALADLRAHLPPVREEGGVRGSLRWLEAQMRARGANPAAVRNIIYRDVGTSGDKAVLRAVLAELAQEAGRPLAETSSPVAPPCPPNWNCWVTARNAPTSSFSLECGGAAPHA